MVSVAACSRSAAAVVVNPPVPNTATRQACERLAQELPASLGKGLARRSTRPDSPLVAAWGSPPAVLRCGVPVEPAYKSGDQVFEVKSGAAKADWYAVKRGDRVVWSTPRATVHVELVVPVKYQGAGLLARLTPAVAKVSVF